MEIVKINGLTKKFKDKIALDSLDLNIKENITFGLLGLNGAGKTTTIKILCDLLEKTSGHVEVLGYDLDKDAYEIKKIVNASPQETAVALNLSVKENLEFFENIYNSDKETMDELVKLFKFEKVMDQRAKTLSGGWQRKLSIAVALISKPKLLFLDEPTLGLDVLARKELWSIISKIKEKTTVVLTSHYLEEIEALCDELAILSEGKKLFQGNVEELKKQTGKDNFNDAFVYLIQGEENE